MIKGKIMHTTLQSQSVEWRDIFDWYSGTYGESNFLIALICFGGCFPGRHTAVFARCLTSATKPAGKFAMLQLARVRLFHLKEDFGATQLILKRLLQWNAALCIKPTFPYANGQFSNVCWYATWFYLKSYCHHTLPHSRGRALDVSLYIVSINTKDVHWRMIL